MSEESTNGGNGVGYGADSATDPEFRALEATFRSLQTDILLARATWARQAGLTFDGARDEYAVLGYDRQITSRQYREEYARGGIAGRIVDVMPDATWRGNPAMELVENENPDTDTEFEQAWKALDQKHQICSKLQRVDRLARLSTYAVLLIGAPGELDSEIPEGNPDQLVYLMPFSGGGGPGGSTMSRMSAADADCTVAEYETDAKNPRFGLPRTYQLKRTDVASPDFMRPVHWTRIVHVAEGLLDDEVFGQPALERVWNLLIDLRKVTGGGSEAFWLRANQGMHIDVDKDMSLPDATNTIAALKEQADAYKHQLDRWIRTRGVDIKTLGSDVANFSNPADAIITQIAGAKSIPKRILTGSEMGELASSQDRENFKDQINGRQSQYAGPYIVRPLANRLIQFGYLPEPRKGPEAYEVRWPHIQTLTEQEKSAGALSWAQTKLGEDPVFTDSEIRDKWYGMEPLTDEQRQEIADRKAEAVQRQQEAMGEAAPAAQAAQQFPRAAQDYELLAQDYELPAQSYKMPVLESSNEDSELLQVLEAAIEANNTDVIDQILGLRHEAPQGPDQRPASFTPETSPNEQALDLVKDALSLLRTERTLGGLGSGNFGHAGRPGEIGGSSESSTAIGGAEHAKKFAQLKTRWANVNAELFRVLDKPDSPIYKAKIKECKEIAKEMHKLHVDPGGAEGIGLPGGPRDMVIIGAGPAGLSASIVGGTEGMDTLFIEGSDKAGGQSRQSSRIENYPGFPAGISGKELAERMQEQAERVGAEGKLGVKVVTMTHDPDTGIKTLLLSNGETVQARTVVLAGGVEFKPGHFPGALNDNVSYSNSEILAEKGAGKSVVIAGGSNGAAQAALLAAETAKSVTLVVRRDIRIKMSEYQVDAIKAHVASGRIKLLEGEEIGSVEGNKLTLKSGKVIDADQVGVFFGGKPDTSFLPTSINKEASGPSKGKLHVDESYQTSVPGVFAVGDIRKGSIARVGVAVGEGQIAAHSAYQYLQKLKRARR